jgi:hypothetical protein
MIGSRVSWVDPGQQKKTGKKPVQVRHLAFYPQAHAKFKIQAHGTQNSNCIVFVSLSLSPLVSCAQLQRLRFSFMDASSSHLWAALADSSLANGSSTKEE